MKQKGCANRIRQKRYVIVRKYNLVQESEEYQCKSQQSRA